MKVGNIPILWTVIAAVFVKTALLQNNRDDRRLGEVDEAGQPGAAHAERATRLAAFVGALPPPVG